VAEAAVLFFSPKCSAEALLHPKGAFGMPEGMP